VHDGDPANIRLAEAPSHGKPALLYDVRSRGAESYIRLAKEIISHYFPSVVEEPAAEAGDREDGLDRWTSILMAILMAVDIEKLNHEGTKVSRRVPRKTFEPQRCGVMPQRSRRVCWRSSLGSGRGGLVWDPSTTLGWRLACSDVMKTKRRASKGRVRARSTSPEGGTR